MAIGKASGVGAATLSALSEAPRKNFGEVLKGTVEKPVSVPKAPACPTTAQAASSVAKPAKQNVQAVAEGVAAAQRRLDHVLQLAQSGRSFSPAELIALQGQVYRASQELDLAGKVIEKATGGVKQILQTQV